LQEVIHISFSYIVFLFSSISSWPLVGRADPAPTIDNKKLLYKNFRFAQLLYVRLCLIKQAYQSPLSLNQHFLTIYNINTRLCYLVQSAA
jgi:hypothetical protein